MGALDLVIFDCDGVLVDSERLTVRTEAVILADLGWPLSEAEVVERFVGRSAAAMHQEVERHLGRRVDWDLEFESPCRAVFEKELAPVPGVVDVLRHIPVPVCVASSGTHERMRFTLGLTGLWDRFEGRIFSVDDVAEGKPAPDVFLHAAASMDVAPDRCAVVEDSVSGVMAGLAAGMTVYAFSGGVTDARQLTEGDAIVFDDMRELAALLAPSFAPERAAETAPETAPESVPESDGCRAP